MQIINASYELLDELDGKKILSNITQYGRICYKSEKENIYLLNARFVASRIKAGHESILEHEKITVKFICDRGISHELVRHRLASYSQESTRYCNYDDKGLTFIKPVFWKEGTRDYEEWKQAMTALEHIYRRYIHTGSTPEQARCILPNSLKTEIIVTANLREWRHILRLRTASDAHPQMRELMRPLLDELKKKIPVIFDDITY